MCGAPEERVSTRHLSQFCTRVLKRLEGLLSLPSPSLFTSPRRGGRRISGLATSAAAAIGDLHRWRATHLHVNVVEEPATAQKTSSPKRLKHPPPPSLPSLSLKNLLEAFAFSIGCTFRMVFLPSYLIFWVCIRTPSHTLSSAHSHSFHLFLSSKALSAMST